MNTAPTMEKDACLRGVLALGHFVWQAAAIGALAGLAGGLLSLDPGRAEEPLYGWCARPSERPLPPPGGASRSGDG